MWLSNIWRQFLDFLFGTSSTTTAPVTRRKKFTVHRSTPRRERKRFEIHSTTPGQSTTAQGRSGIIITGESPPGRCPRCLSRDTIMEAQSANATWQCSGCGQTW